MLFDAHCHIANQLTINQCAEISKFYKDHDVDKIVLMSSNHLDYEWVMSAYSNVGSDLIIPCFGLHPWYCHMFKLGGVERSKKEHYEYVFDRKFENDEDNEFLKVLPVPFEFEQFFNDNYQKFERLIEYNKKLVIGEIGMDKLFKIPNTGYYNCKTNSNQEIKLTKYRTSTKHQLDIFKYQLTFAFRKNLPVSIHNVKAISFIIDLVKEEYKDSETKIMLHSYTGSSESLQMLFKYINKAKVYVSISSLLNKNRYKEMYELIQPNVLIESDISIERYEWQLELLQDVSQMCNVETFNRYLDLE